MKTEHWYKALVGVANASAKRTGDLIRREGGTIFVEEFEHAISVTDARRTKPHVGATIIRSALNTPTGRLMFSRRNWVNNSAIRAVEFWTMRVKACKELL